MTRYATVVKKSVFDMAHTNDGFGEGHKCANIHGHTINYEVAVRSKVNEETGLSVDFGVIKEAMKSKVDNQLDHKFLNKDVAYFREVPPSAENIATYILESVQQYLDTWHKEYEAEVLWVRLDETPTSTIIINRDDLYV